MEENIPLVQPTNRPKIFGLIAVAIILVVGISTWAYTKFTDTSPTTAPQESEQPAFYVPPSPSSLPIEELGQSLENRVPSAKKQITEEFEGKYFAIEAGSYYYKPNVITVSRGDEVKIVLKSLDSMHDIVIDELNLKSDIARDGSSVELNFTANQVGEFEFYCSVESHRKEGMVGTLVVTD